MSNKTKRDKKWLNNKNQLKNPKVFTVTMVRNPDGSMHLIGGETMVLNRINQHTAQWENVDTRDFASVMRKSKITTL